MLLKYFFNTVKEVLSSLFLPGFSIARILDIFNIDGNMPAMSDLLMAKVIWDAKAAGLILRNFILVSLKPLDDEFLDFLMILTTSPLSLIHI